MEKVTKADESAWAQKDREVALSDSIALLHKTHKHMN